MTTHARPIRPSSSIKIKHNYGCAGRCCTGSAPGGDEKHVILAHEDAAMDERGDEDQGEQAIDQPGQAIGRLLQGEDYPTAPGEAVRVGRQARGTKPEPERIKVVRKPMEPSRAARERHEACHLPYADWCRHCVMARSLASQHRVKKHSTAKEVPVVSGDFCFMSQENQVGTTPIHVMRDHNSRKTFAHMGQGKSTSSAEYSQFLVQAVLRDIEHLGHGKMVYKTDQEPAMTAL